MALQSFEEILSHLRIFHKQIHRRLTHRLNQRLMILLDELQKCAYRFSSDVDNTSMQACLEGIRKMKNFYPQKLKPDDVKSYLDMGWEKGEIALLYGTPPSAISTKMTTLRLRDARKKDQGSSEDAPRDFFEIPEFIRNKKPEEWTDEDGLIVARTQLFKAAFNGSVEASNKLMDKFQGFMKSDLKTKWEQVKILDNFFLSHFLPAVQKHIRMNDPLPRIMAEVQQAWGNELSGSETRKANIERIREICHKGRVDAKSIFRDVLAEVSPEIRDVAGRALEMAPDLRRKAPPHQVEMGQPEMDSAVKRAKRRGKWVVREGKPNPDKAQRIFDRAMERSERKGREREEGVAEMEEISSERQDSSPINTWLIEDEETGPNPQE